MAARDESLARLRKLYGEDTETMIAEARYAYISDLCKDALKKPAVTKLTLSDRIDKVMINRWLGLPLFLIIMYLVFQLTFAVSEPFMGWIETGFEWLQAKCLVLGGWKGSLLADGVIGGVGSVLVFVPVIFLLFLALTILEDSGYLARAAFVMDRLMHKIGLNGQSFIPMLLGFGCSIPAIMATRAIKSEKGRLVTILIIPLMSCGARLPIYTLLAAAFFVHYQGLVVWSMYLIGIALAIIMALVFQKMLFSGDSGYFIMELPPYRIPSLRGIAIHVWDRGSKFLVRAGTIIFAVTLLVWFLDHTGVIEPMGKFLAPFFKPCGFGQWQAAVALVFGFLAKEVVVGTFGTLFAGVQEQGGLGQVIRTQLGWSSISAFAFMVFTLVYVPCMATIAVIKQEINSWKWPLFVMFYTTAMAWILAVLTYQVGSLFF
jgi:ferrous iron transport protein B